MAKSKLIKTNEIIAEISEIVVKGYKLIENGAIGGYRKIENGVVGRFQKICDNFVDNFLTREGESVEDAKQRLRKEQEERRRKGGLR